MQVQSCCPVCGGSGRDWLFFCKIVNRPAKTDQGHHNSQSPTPSMCWAIGNLASKDVRSRLRLAAMSDHRSLHF
jgi:hypothetical protein